MGSIRCCPHCFPFLSPTQIPITHRSYWLLVVCPYLLVFWEFYQVLLQILLWVFDFSMLFLYFFMWEFVATIFQTSLDWMFLIIQLGCANWLEFGYLRNWLASDSFGHLFVPLGNQIGVGKKRREFWAK